MPTAKKPKTTKSKATVRKNSTKRPIQRRKTTTSKKHIVDAKLNRVMDEQTGTKSSSSTSRKKSKFPWWGLFAFILFIIFGGMLLYENNQDFRTNLNQMLGSIGVMKTDTEAKPNTDLGEPFEMKLTIIFNKEDEYMKGTIDQYLMNLEQNLINTKVAATWLDKNDEKGKELLTKIDAKFIPAFITDESIKNHPQYDVFGAAIVSTNGEYVFQSEGMEYLQTPPFAGATYLGAAPEQAKVVIIEYASFSCAYCKAIHPVLKKVLEQYGDEVSLVVKHFDRGGIDILLSQAAECANDQGRFGQITDGIYERQSDFFAAMQNTEDPETAVNDLIVQVANDAGANGDTVLACVKEGKYAKDIMTSTSEGREYGVLGTPSFFINSRFVGGAPAEEAFIGIVEEALNK